MSGAGGGGDDDLGVWRFVGRGGAGFDGGDFGGEVEGGVCESGGGDMGEDGFVGGGYEEVFWGERFVSVGV